MSDGVIFLIVIPLVILYFINCVIVVTKKKKYPFVEENEQAQERATSLRRSLNDEEDLNESPKDIEPEAIEGIDIGDDSSKNIEMNYQNFKLVMSKTGSATFNLVAVYFLEYVCTTGFADVLSRKFKDHADDKDQFFIANAYPIFAF
mmetsp:Transcript_12154/g.13855  ORF Transcript_12154/g.13855 Transcript_12154/m.13855 type:complete len:147 (+) Transcript_12154:592-1032(+)